MIPRLSPEDALHPLYQRYLSALRDGGFAGDIRADYATRLVTATDNSVYQVVPQAVLYPRHEDDVVALMRLASREEFHGIKLSPRGGGTGTNGQSLCDGIIVDVSRHLRAIGEVDLDAGTVTVQPGVVLDQLNAFLQPHGVFFAPNLSPSNRATIGGMISTDACGKGSRVYGKTSDHLLELDLVFLDGTRWTSREMSIDELREAQRRDDVVGDIHRVVDEVVTGHRQEIALQFPNLRRFMTGYDLAHVYSADRQRFNLNAIMAGSEGTLALWTSAKLRLTPLPGHKKLVAIRYAEFDDALRAAQELVEHDPGAIETVDDTIVGLARHDPIWLGVAHLIEAPGEPHTKAINLVEFESHDPTVVDAKLHELTQALDRSRGEAGRATGYTVASQKADIAALWTLRKKGVGLLGAARGSRRPIPFVEDTAVPPAQLASYIREFRAILDEHGLRYGMFGHVDVGCLHVRPALDMKDEADERLLRTLSDRVCALVRKYGGVMWGEHGKGYRSEYSPSFFGPELYEQLRRIKAVFDPRNQLNPGKLATPAGSSDKLVSVDGIKRGAFDRQIPAPTLAHYDVTVNCNGNGACFDWDPDHVMCPSAKVTSDRIHSPKGRAGVMREWLRLVTQQGYDPTTRATERLWGASRRADPDDYSHQVYDAMDGCLACKACATHCPIKVDVPAFRSQFFHHYHSRYRRPLKDHFLAILESLLPWMGRAPRLFNALMGWGPSRWFMARVVGLLDTPRLAPRSLRAGLAERDAPRFDAARLRELPADEKARSVLLAQDVFTSYFDTDVVLAAYDLLTALGYRVYVLPFRENGKGLHIKGMLGRFRKVAQKSAALLREAGSTGIAVVGIDPAVTLTYRDEYNEVVESPGLSVQLLPEWLHGQLPTLRPHLEGLPRAAQPAPIAFFGHCTERTAAPHTVKQWREIFSAFGIDATMPDLGCCGMCGVYGHEASHYEESRGVFEMSWAQHMPSDAAGRGRVVTQGHSCRHQIERFAGFVPQHPLQVLVERLRAERPAIAPARPGLHERAPAPLASGGAPELGPAPST